MNEKIIQLLQKYIENSTNSRIDYTKLYNEVEYENRGELSTFLLNECSINPLEEMRIIPPKCFANTPLNKIIIPKNIVGIRWGAFMGCKNLESIFIPNTVINIDQQAFQGCTKLEKVQLSDKLTDISNLSFSDCECLKEITIPNNVTSIGVESFKNCKGLESIVIPDGVFQIKWRSFLDCINLKNIEISDSVGFIMNGAFYNTEALNVEYKGTKERLLNATKNSEHVFNDGVVVHCVDGDIKI